MYKRQLEDRGIAPSLMDGDLEILAGAKPDFIAMNYYSTATVGASRGDGLSLIHI